MKRELIAIFGICGLCLLSGCNTAKPNDPAFAPVYPKPVIPTAAQNGSIYQAETSILLYEDTKARRIGDLVMITLDEKTDASKKASTKAKKTNTTDITNPILFGSTPQFNLPKGMPLASTTNNNLAFNLKSSNDFDGEGESKQNNSLNGTITVTVADVLPNGNLVVRGEKWITLNRGDEYIRISGIVRPQDVSPDNTVSSLRVADARITYSGKDGEVASANIMGWFARFFVSAFWPF